MSGLLGASAPLVLSAVPVPLADGPLPVGLLQAGLALAGLFGMGLRGFLGGGGDDDEDPTEISADEDFLDAGEFGGTTEQDEDVDGLGVDEEDDPLEDIEPRLDDLEAEFDELSSTVSAIRGEHESMKESVDDIESNVRKLLEIYEVVTRGANPFVDEADEVPSAGGGDTFGLLHGDDASSGEDGDETSVDDLFADAEPVEPGEDAVEVDDEGMTAEEPANDAPAADDGAPRSTSRGEGLSFEELKSEFEAPDDEPRSEPPERTPQATASTTPESDIAQAEAAAGKGPAPSAGDGNPDPASPKPYLSALPGGYGAELLTMEWLTYLVGESSLADAIRAIRYYQTVDWITDDVASELQQILAGMTPEREWAAPDGGVPSELTVDHHTQSLEFIAELDAVAGGEGRALGLSYRTKGDVHQGGEDRGIQR